MTLQLVALVALWVAFLWLQLKKSRYNHCTWQVPKCPDQRISLLSARLSSADCSAFLLGSGQHLRV